MLWILFLFWTIITKPTKPNWRSNNFYWTVHSVKTLPNFIDKHSCMCAHTCIHHTYCTHIHTHHETESQSNKRHLLPAEPSKQFSIHATGLLVADVPKAPLTSVSSQQPFPRMASVDKAPSGHLLTGTRGLWVLNGKDLLSKASVSQSHPSPRGQGAEVLISYGNYKVNQ